MIDAEPNGLITPPRRRSSAVASPRTAQRMSKVQQSRVRATVSLRLRPVITVLDDDAYYSKRSTVEAVDVTSGLATYEGKQFKFSHVFDESSTQAEVFEAHRIPVLNVLKGFDATIMAYGSTGAGKTHTCQGNSSNPGLISRAFDTIFEHVDHLGADDAFHVENSASDADPTMSSEPIRRHVLQVSALEILEDQCVDLLHDRTAVTLRTAADGLLHFGGLREVEVKSRQALDELVDAATQARTVAANYRHDGSSRSHFVLRLRVDSARIECHGGRQRSRGSTMADATSGVLTLIDLAGSEAALQNRSKSAVSQGITINKSLHWLKKAVHDLAARRPPQLRNSPLTRLLGPSLTGGAHVAIIVCSSASPPRSSARDTLDCLSFGEEAGYVQLSPHRHTEVSVAAEKILGPEPAQSDDEEEDGPGADADHDYRGVSPDSTIEWDGQKFMSVLKSELGSSGSAIHHSMTEASDKSVVAATLLPAAQVPPSPHIPAIAEHKQQRVPWRSALCCLLITVSLAVQQWSAWTSHARAEEEAAKAAAEAAAATVAAQRRMVCVMALLVLAAGRWATTCSGHSGAEKGGHGQRTAWERRDSRLWRTGGR